MDVALTKKQTVYSSMSVCITYAFVKKNWQYECKQVKLVVTTDLYKYSPDAVPPIQYVSSHVATDKDPSK